MYRILILCLAFTLFISCKKDEATQVDTPDMVFYMQFSATQARLDNFGQPSSIGAGNAAQTPQNPRMAAHYIELSPEATTPLGDGVVVYNSPSTTVGGSQAIDWAQLRVVSHDQEYARIELKNIPPGTYRYIRVSLAYQEGNLNLRVPATAAGDLDGTGLLRSYVGYRNYLTTITQNGQTKTVNGNRLQGFWAFYSDFAPHYTALDTGRAAGTTVPNPINATSPIPAGSCVVTGQFDPPLVITGSETTDIGINTSFSINTSFEWSDPNNNDLWEPTTGEQPVDMGVRGLVPSRR